MEAPNKHRVLIIGGGFAGVEAARRLQRGLPRDWEIVLYSQENHFVFTPLLSDVVGATITPIHVVCPIRQMVREVSCRTAQVVGLNCKNHEVRFERPNGQLGKDTYDHLVLAAGLGVNMNTVPGMARYGWPLKTLGDAVALRMRIIGQLERAQVAMSPEFKARLLSFAVVGGGITGIEIAGAVADLLRGGCRYYDRIDPQEIRVTVIHSRARILDQFPESLSSFAQRKIGKGRLDIRTQARVGEVTVEGIRLQNGEFIRAGTVITAVGNTIQPLFPDAGLPVERDRIKVLPDMRVEGCDSVWALGDCAAVPNAFDGSPSPTLGQFAVRQARQLSKNLIAVIEGRSPKPFKYRMHGMFATIGRHNAVGLLYGIHFSGFPASLCWHGVYWTMMPTIVRKVQVGLDWLLGYVAPANITTLSSLPTGDRMHEDEVKQLAGFFDKHPELRELRVSEVMRRTVPTLKKHVTITEAIHLCREQGTSVFPVVDEEGRLEGICSRTDLYRAVNAARGPDTVVGEIMTAPVITVREDALIDDAIELAATKEVRHLVVVNDVSPDRPVGMLTSFDLVYWFVTQGKRQEASGASRNTPS
ncbi:MAG: FAD-dependent oxidoreductase [Nitrospiraceae bacterium]